jgi:hypothetical protein
MKEKTELLTNFKFFSIPMVEILHKEIPILCNFSFLEINKVEPANKVQSLFLERNAFNARQTSLLISFNSLIKWNEPKVPL